MKADIWENLRNLEPVRSYIFQQQARNGYFSDLGYGQEGLYTIEEVPKSFLASCGLISAEAEEKAGNR